eukprot:11124890-Ditylum_brightwellii.AAC.1
MSSDTLMRNRPPARLFSNYSTLSQLGDTSDDDPTNPYILEEELPSPKYEHMFPPSPPAEEPASRTDENT